MQRVRISVTRRRGYASSDGFQVFWDGGTGVIDWVHPVSPRRQAFWPEAAPAPGHVAGAHVLGRHLDSVCPEGHLQGAHLLDEALCPAAIMSCESQPLVFGRFRFGVAAEDQAGNINAAGGTVQEFVVNAEPAPGRELRCVACDGGGRLTFDFLPSERLVG